MDTLILTFKGGDNYNKKKQVLDISLKEENCFWKEVTLNTLEENILLGKKIIILREDINLSKFEYIIKSEFYF